jgi:uncharacterized membrane protein HdeD (DUF308 family)
MKETLQSIQPDWLNAASIRGAAFIGGGLLALTVPTLSERVIGIVFVGVILVKGLTDVWVAWKRRPIDRYDLFVGIAWVAGGAVLLVFTDSAKTVIPMVFGALVGLLGIVIMIRALGNRRTNPTWTFNLVRGGIYVATGVVVAVLPDALGTSLVLVISVVAILYGALMMAIGISTPEAGDVGPGELAAFARSWLTDRDLGDKMREDVVDNLFFEAPAATQKKVGFWVSSCFRRPSPRLASLRTQRPLLSVRCSSHPS